MTAENIDACEGAEKVKSSAVDQLEPSEITEILEYLSGNEKIVFKSQQIDDPEFSRTEKVNLAREIYLRNRQTFLLRFGAYMEETHLCAFAQTAICEGVSPPLHREENYDEMQYMLFNYRHKLHTRKQDVKNRRYAAMQKMLKDGDYFSEQEMMKRAPQLYHELIGQYLTEAEKKIRDGYDVRNTTFSGILMHTMEQQELRDVMKHVQTEDQIDTQNDDLLDDASSKDSTDIVLANNLNETKSKETKERAESVECFGQQWGNFDNETVVCVAKAEKVIGKKSTKGRQIQQEGFITAGERALLKEEFIGIMQQQFLAGKDADFNYNEVDEDSKLDDLQQLNQDKEDAYFDDSEEEEQRITEDNSSITKELNEESDDELDIYMSHLNRHHSLHTN